MNNKLILWVVILLSCSQLSLGQAVVFDSTGLKIITITHADSALGFKTDQKSYQRLIGAVSIAHDGVTLTCDSAHLYMDQNMVEAYSNVQIMKANGTQASSNYIKYTGNNHTAFMQGAVQIIDGNNTLNTEELTYNVKTKIGKYFKNGTLQNEETTVTSEKGTYNGFNQQAYFVKEVVITNPKYTIHSKELTYNTKTKIVKFLDESIINTENSIIETTSGTYNASTSNAEFNKRTTIENEDQIVVGNYITYDDKSGSAHAKGDVLVVDIKNNSKMYADRADYNKLTGNGTATGHVIIIKEEGKNTLVAKKVDYNKKNGYVKATGDVILIDTVEKSKLIGECVEFNENTTFMLATGHPKLITLADQDSLFMRADTIVSVRIKDSCDLAKIVTSKDPKTKELIYSYNLLFADSTYKSENDSTEPKLIIANAHVKIFSDSMQAVCDSLSYSQLDSMFRMFKAPILWNNNHQANADTIFMHTVNDKLSEANLINTALLTSASSYENIFDQISGNYIDAFFTDNKIQEVRVNQNAESIYYPKDDQNAFIGLNRSESASMRAYFKDEAIERIVLLNEPKGSTIPIDKINDGDKFLPTYKSFTTLKPKSKEEILND